MMMINLSPSQVRPSHMDIARGGSVNMSTMVSLVKRADRRESAARSLSRKSRRKMTPRAKSIWRVMWSSQETHSSIRILVVSMTKTTMATMLQQNLKTTRILPLKVCPEMRLVAHSCISAVKEPGEVVECRKTLSGGRRREVKMGLLRNT